MHFTELIPLKKNSKQIKLSDATSLCAMLVPAVGLLFGLVYLSSHNSSFIWLHNPRQYPFELWVIAISGTIATLGGFGDWLFHRHYVTAGPKERHAHLLALGTGGVPLFLLMVSASLLEDNRVMLLPILAVLIYTVSLICYDEFIFHRKRCLLIETMMHRLLVFGNGAAFFAWMHWCYVR